MTKEQPDMAKAGAFAGHGAGIQNGAMLSFGQSANDLGP